jgi:hypothetical protein
MLTTRSRARSDAECDAAARLDLKLFQLEMLLGATMRNLVQPRLFTDNGFGLIAFATFREVPDHPL